MLTVAIPNVADLCQWRKPKLAAKNSFPMWSEGGRGLRKLQIWGTWLQLSAGHSPGICIKFKVPSLALLPAPPRGTHLVNFPFKAWSWFGDGSSLNEDGPLGTYIGMLVSLLEEQGRFRKQGLVGGGVSPGMGFKFSKAQAILEGKDLSSPANSLAWCLLRRSPPWSWPPILWNCTQTPQ